MAELRDRERELQQFQLRIGIAGAVVLLFFTLLGTDVIRVGLIYRTDTVEVVGTREPRVRRSRCRGGEVWARRAGK